MRLSKKIGILSLGTIMAGALFFSAPVLADNSLLNQQTLLQEVGGQAYNTKKPQDAKKTILEIVNVILGFLALIAVILLVVSGFQYMISGGNKDKMSKALGNIKSLAVGLVIVLAAWGIAYYILNVLVCVTTTNGAVECKNFW
ncbi:MAG: pilin [Candidatus Parcubacteria bacterium]|jgi:hypothetical protein|nr:MAG: hypothetical protein JST_0200 [Candidatus Parcubacteria bacterium]